MHRAAFGTTGPERKRAEPIQGSPDAEGTYEASSWSIRVKCPASVQTEPAVTLVSTRCFFSYPRPSPLVSFARVVPHS